MENGASGRVRSTLETGSVILTGADGDVTLAWSRGEKGDPRFLPAGTYRLRTARIERMEGEHHWFLSAIPPERREVVVEKGKVTFLQVAERVLFRGHGRWKGNRLNLGFTISAPGGGGMSVYADDRRVPVTYRVLGKGGAELASGTMNYG